MNLSTNLFDPRGGSLQSHRCEVCNELLDEESTIPVCAEHELGEEGEYDH